MLVVTLTAHDRDDGTVVTFSGIGPHDEPVVVAVDPRMARAIREALTDGPVVVHVEPWQLLGRVALS